MCFNTILTEQDKQSAYTLNEKLGDSTFLDIGGAEGYITLTVLSCVREAVIFECDEKWAEALVATFESYRDKVGIVSKFAGRNDSGDTVCDDSVVKGKNNVVSRIDVEGMEKFC